MTPDLSPENMYWLAGGTTRLCTAARWPSPVVALRMACQGRSTKKAAAAAAAEHTHRQKYVRWMLLSGGSYDVMLLLCD
jgi:hypothetical protein